jgi:integrase
VRKRWHRPTLWRAELSGIRLHDLRHTAPTLWLTAGESIYFVKEQLGHAEIQTTINLTVIPTRPSIASTALVTRCGARRSRS